jgi:serine phosphatase RsbU (regulator of sigma subunit)
MMKLSIKTPGKPPVTVEVRKLRMTIGRSVRNEICLEDPFSSRIHAELRVDGDTYWLTDLGSANGTFVNGKRVTGTIQMFSGDRIQIGETLIELQPAAEAITAPAVSTTDRLLAAEVVATPEATKEPTDRTVVTSGLLSIIETVRNASGAKEEIEAVEHRKDLFAVVSKVGVALLSQCSLDETLNQIIDLIFEGVPADRAFLLLRDGKSGELVCKVASYRNRQPTEADREVRISRSITEEVVGKGRSVLTSDASQDERFRQQESILLQGIRSVMAVPLSVNQQVIGMIYVDSPMSVNIFTQDDLHLLTTIASVAAVKIENALLLEQRIDNERIKQQLNSARDIQSRLLPVTPPAVPHYDLAGISLPCFEVGGDYFDFIQAGSHRLMISLGDVSGKGMDAAMLMSSLHATVRAQVGNTSSLSEMVSRVNAYLYENTPSNKYATLVCSQLDAESHQLTYTNAGHNPPLLIRRNGEVVYLEAGGLPVGIAGFSNYEEGAVTFESEDALIIYSDGVSESTNRRGEEFGTERLIDVVQKNQQRTAAQLRDRIEEAITNFLDGGSPSDDMTLVIVKRTD